MERALGEFRSLGRTAFLRKYGFDKARKYFVRDPATGNLADSKAIVAAAHGYEFPALGPLNPRALSEKENAVAGWLGALGFEVATVGSDWSEEEVRLTVADYFDMLRLEAERRPYVKAEHNRALRERLRSRSKSAVELKHQNTSAVLNELDLPYIPGYRPRGNYQQLLRDEVRRYISDNPEVINAIRDGFTTAPEQPSDLADFEKILIEIPRRAARRSVQRRSMPRKFDFSQQDARNRALGRLGERWVVQYERERLKRAGRADLSESVEWISDTQGDGAGFDVRSHEPDGSEIFIEVKTTNRGEFSPFLLSPNELERSRELGSKFRLYRVFEFFIRPRLFIIPGPIDAHVTLEPSEYRARLGPPG